MTGERTKFFTSERLQRKKKIPRGNIRDRLNPLRSGKTVLTSFFPKVSELIFTRREIKTINSSV